MLGICTRGQVVRTVPSIGKHVQTCLKELYMNSKAISSSHLSELNVEVQQKMKDLNKELNQRLAILTLGGLKLAEAHEKNWADFSETSS